MSAAAAPMAKKHDNDDATTKEHENSEDPKAYDVQQQTLSPRTPVLEPRQLQQLSGYTTPPCLKTSVLQESFSSTPDSQEHRPTEEFDDEGNVVKVENLVFIEGILGQGAFGTVRLARRKFYHHNHGGNSSSSSGVVNSPATNPARKILDGTLLQIPRSPFQGRRTFAGHRPRRNKSLSKSTSEPRKKSDFFHAPDPEDSHPASSAAAPSSSRTLAPSHSLDGPDFESKDGTTLDADAMNGDSTTTHDLSPIPSLPTNLQPLPESAPQDHIHHLRHRTVSSPIGHKHRGRQANHHTHGWHSPSVIGNLGLFTRSRSSLNHEEQYGQYDDDEQLVAVKIFSKSILKRKRTMERDKSTKRIKVKTAWDQVEREIALMKKLSHPNLVQMYEVIDSPESDMLYMVLEYLPGGEILSYQDDGTFRRKNPRAADASYKQIDGVVDGHFDEEHAALYFVDILHGLAYLHQHHVCHRDLKPENILLDARGVAKVGDFGVSHIFEKESKVGAQRMEPITEGKHYQGEEKKVSKSFGDSRSDSSASSLEDLSDHERLVPKLTRKDTDAALSMRGMAGFGMLSKTEGTWCFWSPEMCEGSQSFSGYAADMWAAGVCLYIFVTGKLPFYSEIPRELFDMIATSEISYAGLGLSNSLVDLLKRCLEKDPTKRAGVGDCLKHPFLQIARQKRIKLLSEEFEISSKKKIVISEEDLKMAFRSVTSVPVQVLRSAGKKIQESLAHTRDRLTFSASSISDGDTLVKHFQDGIQHLRSRRLSSMGSNGHSGDEASATGPNAEPLGSKKLPCSDKELDLDLKYRQESKCPSKQRVVFFRRRASDDSDRSLNTFDESSPAVSDRQNESGLVSLISRLSSGVSCGSTDDIPKAVLEVENEEGSERIEDAHADTGDLHEVSRTLKTKEGPSNNELGRRHEAPVGALEKRRCSDSKKQWKEDKLSNCSIQ